MAVSGPLAVLGAIGVRRVRLICGLILFTYVSTHLTNHALGNFSLPTMERGLRVQKFLWQGVLGTIALYSAFLIHSSLGLWALYERRYFRWSAAEMLQLVLGLSIPPLLINHLIVTRLSLALFHTDKGYAQEFYSFWIKSPELGAVQLAVLIVAWIHGCLGVYFWLRLKRFFGRAVPFLSAAAILLPVLALLGYLQGGRAVVAAAADPAWRAAELTPAHVGTPPENARLTRLRVIFLWGDGAAVALVVLARGVRVGRERRRGLVRLQYPDGRWVQIARGLTILDASRVAKFPHASVCGGRARCSTCRVRIIGGADGLPAPNPIERAVLSRVDAGPMVRLACQVRPHGALSVVPLIAPELARAIASQPQHRHPGEERFVVAMFVDMRESARLAEERLPFDSVFILNRFLHAAASGVAAAGGTPAQFAGDGMLALFGSDVEPETACRQALRAIGLVGARIEALSQLLAGELGRPLGFGIGVASGTAVLGEVGYRHHVALAALGDPTNVASRLQDLSKTFGCEAVISEETFRLGTTNGLELPRRETTLRGREQPVTVRLVDRATDLMALWPKEERRLQV